MRMRTRTRTRMLARRMASRRLVREESQLVREILLVRKLTMTLTRNERGQTIRHDKWIFLEEFHRIFAEELQVDQTR
jgi:hypothetical protein